MADRRTALVAGVGLLAISTLAFFRVPLLGPIGDDLALSAPQIGAITVLFAVGRLLADVPAGELADRIAPGAAYVLAGALMAAGSGLVGVAGSAAVVWVGAFAVGVASSIANTTGMTFFARRAGRASRGRSLAIFSSALLVGQSLGPALSGLVAAATSWRGAMALAVACALAVAAACARLGAAGAGTAGRPGDGAGGAGGAGGEAAGIGGAELATLYAVCFCAFFALGAMPQTIVPLIGDRVLALGAGAIGLAVGMGGVFRLIGAWIAGVVSDRVGRKAALVPGMLASATGVALVAAVGPGSTALWLVAIALMSLGSVGVTVGATILGDRTGGPRSGRRFGQYRLSGDLGLLTGPLLGTILYGAVSHDAPAILVAAMLAACALAAAVVVREPSRTGAR